VNPTQWLGRGSLAGLPPEASPAVTACRSMGMLATQATQARGRRQATKPDAETLDRIIAASPALVINTLRL